MTPRQIKTSELEIGDTVRRVDAERDPFSTTIVTQIKGGRVHLFRPYGTTADFSYTGGVIPYIGIETYDIEQFSDTPWVLYNRQTLR